MNHTSHRAIEGYFGTSAPRLTKLATRVEDGDVRHLLWLRNLLGEHLLDAMVLYSGNLAYRRKDGVAVIPAALLCP
ncbi:MAG: hypothetical protein LBG65_05815 [Puniceicoccales bacterium]|jgi:hypothetical protein|nr:hypothetical protein [Puniceicoccales bacterium]